MNVSSEVPMPMDLIIPDFSLLMKRRSRIPTSGEKRAYVRNAVIVLFKDYTITRLQDYKFQDYKIARLQDCKIKRFRDQMSTRIEDDSNLVILQSSNCVISSTEEQYAYNEENSGDKHDGIALNHPGLNTFQKLAREIGRFRSKID